MLQVYTGNGKGKTTAAIGLAIRALGAGKKVYVMQFMKSLCYSEQKVLQGFAPELTLRTSGKPFFIAEEGKLSYNEFFPALDINTFRKGALIACDSLSGQIIQSLLVGYSIIDGDCDIVGQISAFDI